MDRVYSNRLPGEERIHVEITREEIREMRARPAGPAARAFWGLLATADHQFTGVTLEDPKSAAPGASPRCVCGDPIERWDGPGEPGWIHSPGSDTRCLAARAAARQTTGQDDTGPTCANDPTPLRWGLGDVLHGDDDSVTVCFSGPDREPYWLELDAERRDALRDDLAPVETHVVTDDSDDPEHTDDCPGCEDAAVGQPAEAHNTEQLVPVGWWCWRGNDHGHLAHTACRSDNVPIHVPAEWADNMRAVIQHLTDDHDPDEDCTWVTPEEQAAETPAAADTVEDETR